MCVWIFVSVMTEFPKTPPRTPRAAKPRPEEAPRIAFTPKSAVKTPKRLVERLPNEFRAQTSREVAEIVAVVSAAKKMRVIEVNSDTLLTESVLCELTSLKVPIVFRKLAAGWKCVQDWSKPGYLAKAASIESATLPHRKYRQFVAHSAENGRLHLTDGKSKAKSVSIEEFLDHAKANKDEDGLYLLGIHSRSGSLSYCPVQPHLDDKQKTAPLVNDVPSHVDFLEWYAKFLAPQNGEPVRYDHQQFFLAKGYAFTDLHYDSYDNFYVAVSGTRRWTLGCPNASRWLIDGGALKSGSFAVPHLKQFGKSTPAQIYPFAYVDLNPGDVLFVPTCWWHLVESKPGKDGFSSAFNFFFSKPPDEVFGEFQAQLAATDAMVNALQSECRANMRRDTGKTSDEKFKLETPTRMDAEIWKQLVKLANVHEMDLATLHAKWESMSIEPYACAQTEQVEAQTEQTGAKAAKPVAQIRAKSEQSDANSEEPVIPTPGKPVAEIRAKSKEPVVPIPANPVEPLAAKPKSFIGVKTRAMKASK